MSSVQANRQIMVDKFTRLYARRQGGILTNKTRQKILTKKGISGRGMTKNQFWYRQRENVKTAMIDLLLFVQMAGKENVNQVITKESLKPIFDVLLWHPVVKQQEPDLPRAEIAHLIIKAGFDYLREMKRDNIPLSSHRTIEEAVDLSNYLVELFKPEKERAYSTPYYGYSYSC